MLHVFFFQKIYLQIFILDTSYVALSSQLFWIQNEFSTRPLRMKERKAAIGKVPAAKNRM
jgi:hypothetical protein